MADIFISYASEDRDKARQLAQTLADLGLSVFWDRVILPGQTFDEVIEAQLDNAACVIVLWSRASISSDWVKTEAAEAAGRKVLIPVLIENVRPPLEFRRIQAGSLIDWAGQARHPDLEALLKALAAKLGRSVGNETAPLASDAAALGSVTDHLTHPGEGAPRGRTAYASYAVEDRLRVLDRVSALTVGAGLDVFMDNLALHPGDQWKHRLEREIAARDLFLLFWSSHAQKSIWVDWEWRAAIRLKGLNAIQVHSLEPVSEAPPPRELSSLHFSDLLTLARSAYERRGRQLEEP